MSEYLSDAEEKEQLLEWWKDNGRFIVTGVGLGLIGIFAWRAWTTHLDKQAGSAAVVYSEMVQAADANQSDKVDELLNKINSDFKGTSYVAQANLLKARVSVQEKQLPEAVQALQNAIATSKDAELTELANFRLAKLQLAQKDYSAALGALEKVKSKSYVPLIAELKGDVFYAQGDLGKAQEQYKMAQKAMQETPIGDPNLLQMKLSDLGVSLSEDTE